MQTTRHRPQMWCPFIAGPSRCRSVAQLDALLGHRVKYLFFVGASPSGPFLVVCKAIRDEGVAPTTKDSCKLLWNHALQEKIKFL